MRLASKICSPIEQQELLDIVSQNPRMLVYSGRGSGKVGVGGGRRDYWSTEVDDGRPALSKLGSLSPDQSQLLRYFATRWTVKEACYKAFSSSSPQLDQHRIEWRDVTVARSKLRRPVILFSTDFQERLKADSIQLSPMVTVSHDGEYCMAQVALQLSKII